MALPHAASGYSRTEAPAFQDIVKGTWSVRFEKEFSEVIPVFQPSRRFWGRLEYAVFRQGRKGVVIGRDGWLFSDEELSCPRHAQTLMDEHLVFIGDARDALNTKGVKLAVAVIPAKARLYEAKLPAGGLPDCRQSIYADTQSYLDRHKITHADLLSAFQKGAEKQIFLKTDTHWTPDGAALAALAISKSHPAYKAEEADYVTKLQETKPYSGDLLRYAPGVDADSIRPDELQTHVTYASTPADGHDLFDGRDPSLVLVGTSYSANPLWNFEGALKDALNTDILNMADEGKGPFSVMEKYVESLEKVDTLPQLVIWEIPERYMILPDDRGVPADRHAKKVF